MPDIEVIKGERMSLLRVKRDILKLPLEERRKIIKTYFQKVSKRNKILIRLYKSGAITPKKAIKITDSDVIDELVRLKRIKKTRDKKIYLTELGKNIAQGAIDIWAG